MEEQLVVLLDPWRDKYDRYVTGYNLKEGIFKLSRHKSVYHGISLFHAGCWKLMKSFKSSIRVWKRSY
jgi:hypothetical protein